MEAEYEACEGFLFKLKENKKEWKKLYVKLSGAEIIYYDSPHAALADKRQKDGVKQVVTAFPYNEFSGVNAPTGTPAYLIIETSHAKKIYCAKTQQERAKWVDAVRQNGEKAKASGLLKGGPKASPSSGSKVGGVAKQAILDKGAAMLGGLKSVGFRARGASIMGGGGGASSEALSDSAGRDEISAGGRLSVSGGRLSIGALGRRSTSSSVGRESSASLVVPELYIADEDLDEMMHELVETLGLKGPHAAAVHALKPEAKREMLKMNNLTQAQRAEKVDAGSEPKNYVHLLLDDPDVNELTSSSVWLSTAPMADVEAFIKADGIEALASVLATLCRHASRSAQDEAKVEAAMRCLTALVKTEACS